MQALNLDEAYFDVKNEEGGYPIAAASVFQASNLIRTSRSQAYVKLPIELLLNV